MTEGFTFQRKKIFCYGDSLTAGTAPPQNELFPFGPHLERSLGTNYYDSDDNSSPMVRWLGLPGWTSAQMVSELYGSVGLTSKLKFIEEKTNDKVTLAIVLAGTNDLGFEQTSEPITNSILALHKAAHEEGVHTLALSLPPSAWQRQSSVAKKLAEHVNESLRAEAAKFPDMMDYVEFPIQEFDAQSDYWCPDGLHFSPRGYEYIGENLAPTVQKVLEKLK
jgi:lysophospholipase L1-like esterase